MIHRKLKTWVPICVLVVFSIGVTVSFFYAVHAQDSLQVANAIDIAGLKRQLSDLGDLPVQVSAMRERMAKLEGDVSQAKKQLDGIDAKGDWLVFGVFGILLTQVIKGIKFPFTSKEDTSPEIKLYK